MSLYYMFHDFATTGCQWNWSVVSSLALVLNKGFSYILEINALFNLIQNKNFMILFMQQKFIWLMSDESIICIAVSQFILQSFDKRVN